MCLLYPFCLVKEFRYINIVKRGTCYEQKRVSTESPGQNISQKIKEQEKSDKTRECSFCFNVIFLIFSGREARY